MHHLILVLKFIPRRSAFIIFAKMFTSEIRPSSKSKFNILEYETKNAIRADNIAKNYEVSAKYNNYILTELDQYVLYSYVTI